MESLCIQLSDYIYLSQFRKIDTYDWFCGSYIQGHIYHKKERVAVGWGLAFPYPGPLSGKNDFFFQGLGIMKEKNAWLYIQH